MSMHTPPGTALDKLVMVLTELREANLPTAECIPGNELAREGKHEAIGFLRALDQVAAAMGLKTEIKVVYST